jgi:hypothetical protein
MTKSFNGSNSLNILLKPGKIFPRGVSSFAEENVEWRDAWYGKLDTEVYEDREYLGIMLG